MGDSKGIGGGVELARFNLRKQGAQVWRVPPRAGNSLLVKEEIVKKDPHQREREDVMKNWSPIK